MSAIEFIGKVWGGIFALAREVVSRRHGCLKRQKPVVGATGF
jgi:hypothetical protein